MQIFKNPLNGGYTAYHGNGRKSITHRNVTDGGYTTYHSSGGKSKTYKNITDGGYTTWHSDGSKSTTYKHITDNGYTTYHDDGRITKTYKNLTNDGYTSYETGGGGDSVGGDLVMGGLFLFLGVVLLLPLFLATKYMVPVILLFIAGFLVRWFFRKKIMDDLYSVGLYISCGLWLSAFLNMYQAMLLADYSNSGGDWPLFILVWVLFGPIFYGLAIIFSLERDNPDDAMVPNFIISTITIVVMLAGYASLYGFKTDSEKLRFVTNVRWLPPLGCTVLAGLRFLVVWARRGRRSYRG